MALRTKATSLAFSIGLASVAAITFAWNQAPLARAGSPEVNAADTWTEVAPMPAAAWGHAATLLADGRVLVAGGNNGQSISRRAFLYDPRSDTWSPTGDMAVPREMHTATLLPHGQVLVTGGLTDGLGLTSLLSSAERYDPPTNSWVPAADMGGRRFYHSAALLTDGRVLVAGGSDGPWSGVATAETYDYLTDTWNPATPMSTGRSFLSLTNLNDGTVLAAGGYNDFAPNYLASAERYDPTSNSWTAAGELHEGRELQTAVVLNDGRVLVAGGAKAYMVLASAEIYDPYLNTWTIAGSMSSRRQEHASVLLRSGRVLVAGGFSGSGALASAEVYDADSNQWAQAPSMSSARETASMLLLADGRALITGGLSGAPPPLRSVETYGEAAPPTATPTPSNTPPPTATATNTAAPTATPTPTNTPTPTFTSTPTSTNTPTVTPTPCLDTDCDGIPDTADNCPTTANADQRNTNGEPLLLPKPDPKWNDATNPAADTEGDACDADIDGDGVLNTTEAAMGLNPNFSDTDGDRTNDGTEIACGSDPLNAASILLGLDADHDSLPDACEGIYGTNPSISDTDADGVTDGVEIRYWLTNPLVRNTDGDGCGDGKEIATVNGDRVVNSIDLAILASVFNQQTATLRPYDQNGDGIINSIDLALSASQFGPC